MNFTLTRAQSKLVESLRTKKFKIWIVGGAVRDSLLGLKPKDLDFAHNASAEFVATTARELGLTVADDKTALEHGIVRIADSETKSLIDFARLRKDDDCDGRHAKVTFTDDIEADLARRDLTINAMAIEVFPDGTCEGLSQYGCAEEDIKDKSLAFVGNMHDRIREDYLRLMRICRFAALGDGWEIAHPITEMKKHAIEIGRVSKERIRDELVKGLMYPRPSRMFRAMHAIGLLDIVFPDLARGVGVTQNIHHAEPVFDHLLRCLDSSVAFTDNPMLRLSVLCHDIAKPHTKKMVNGDATFYRHEVVGASVTYEWMRLHKFPRKDCEYVSKMVRHHQWRFEEDTSDKTIRHWLQEVGPEWRDLITLRMADRAGNLKKEGRPLVTQKMKELIARVEAMILAKIPLFKEDLALNGDDLITMGIKPGPLFKDIFSNILGIVVADPGKNTKEWLTQYVKKNYLKEKEAPK